jgi:hypothetical protein
VRSRRGALLLTLLAGQPCLALSATGGGQVEVEAGVDSNPARAFDAPPSTDGVLLGQGDVEGQLRPLNPWLLSGRYDLGAKHFFHTAGEDVLAQAAAAEASARPLPPLALGLALQAKDRTSRAGERDYRDLGAALFGELRALPPVLTLEAGAEQFTYKPDHSFSFAGPRAALSGIQALARQHRVHLGASAAYRAFEGVALNQSGQVVGPRRDWDVGAAAGYAYRGAFLATLDYAFDQDRSNAYGQGSQRHRLEGSLAVFLPLKVALAARGVLQLTRFPDGVAASPQLLLLEDNENTDQVGLKLSRTWASGLEAELEAQAYRADFPANGLHYRRNLVQAGVGWRF